MPPLIFTVGCSIDGCARKHEAKGLCGMHYQRLVKHGTVADPLRFATVADRFWAKVIKGTADECWLWTANTGAGYGRFWYDGHSEVAHRVAYELTKGPIPDGLHIDHLCRVRLCMNPAHLEAVTQQENNYRAGQVQTEEMRRKRSAAGRKGAAVRWGQSGA